MPTVPGMSRLVMLAVSSLPLAACISFGAKPPPTLMTLSAAEAMPAGPARVAREGESVTIAVPGTPPELGGLRVPVKAGANAVAYLKDAQWADAPARLFRNLLAETIATRTGRVTFDQRQYALAPGIRLGGRVVDFGVDAPANQVIATYDATLVRRDGAPVETRRFQATLTVSAKDAATVAAALSQASNRIAVEVADWIGAVR